MDRLPFDKPGNFRKGNIHTHSTASDGTLPPEEVCRRYREAGYDFLAITYHFLEQFDYRVPTLQRIVGHLGVSRGIVGDCSCWPFRWGVDGIILHVERHRPTASPA